MATGPRADSFVLVHGAFVGGWYWDPVVRRLRAKGHHVRAIDLTGHGAQSARNARQVTLQDHIDDVVTAIDAAPLGAVILVAHSYGGRPATGAWDLRRDRVRMVIYLEAVAPYGSGDYAIPPARQDLARLAVTDARAAETGLVSAPPHIAARYPGQVITPHSVAALYAGVPLTQGPLPQDTEGAYVLGERSRAQIFRQYAARLQAERGWTIWEIDSGHDMVHDAADVLVRLLDALARGEAKAAE